MSEQYSFQAQVAIDEIYALRQYEAMLADPQPGYNIGELQQLVNELTAKHPKIKRMERTPLDTNWDEEPATPAEALMYNSLFARIGETLNGWPW